MLKMATYPGMSLGGEVRESISLDEDDLSDVEDEVFIRDGKNSYKLAEELNVKRPLMAPRRKLGRPDLTTRLKAKPPCRIFCRPCCYIFAALTVLIGLIAVAVVVVSIFPLPLNRLRDWVIVPRVQPAKNSTKLLPCSSLKITDIWAATLPVLTTDSPIRLLDVTQDGVEDVIFGFGTGSNYNKLPPNIFCPIFMGAPPPCEGGVIALNGATGEPVWRYWTNDTIFTIQCTSDLNEDGLEDCLAIGLEGTLAAIDSRNGSTIWLEFYNKMDVLVANFIPDQNNDTVDDILSSLTSLDEQQGHLVLISGKTGKEIRRNKTPNGAKSFFMPQILGNGSQWVIYGTGGPNSPGNLSVTTLESLTNENMSSRTIYEDHFKGAITQSVLVDITGDDVLDIVTAMYNSTVVAINGVNFSHIWNFTIEHGETNIIPTPGYFNNDPVPDFLIIYEQFDNILNYNYTRTFILDGISGKPIYTKSISNSLSSQLSGLTLAMELYGFDMFLFWTTECSSVDNIGKINSKNRDILKDPTVDLCRAQFNATTILKLNALNQYDQPPGLEIYNSINRTSMEFNNAKSPLKLVREYFAKHAKLQRVNNNEGQSEFDEPYLEQKINDKIKVHKYGTSSFRHKDNRQGIVKDYMISDSIGPILPNEGIETKYEPDFDQTNIMNIPASEIDPDFNINYSDDETGAMFNQKQDMFINSQQNSNRDPRSKEDILEMQTENPSMASSAKSKKKNLSEMNKYGIYDYKNIKMSRNRLLHDLNNLPSEILRDTFFKNRENQLRTSKFEQRDINSHIDKMKQNEELRSILDSEKRAAENASYTLWDLESEKELQDKENGYYRGKRQINYALNGIRRVSSVGAIADSFNSTENTIDIIFITYWQPNLMNSREQRDQEINDCIELKLSTNNLAGDANSFQKTSDEKQRRLFMDECLIEQQNIKRDFPYFNDIYQLRLGQMTVYRIRVQCLCEAQTSRNEKCAKFLTNKNQNWATYLGKMGDGVFYKRN